MYILESKSPHTVWHPKGGRVKPGDGFIVDDAEYTENPEMYRYQAFKTHRVRAIPYNWKDWRAVEYVRLHQPPTPGRGRIMGFKHEQEVRAYLDEKVPNTNPGLLHAGLTTTLILVAGVSTGMWRDVVRPGLVYIAKNHDAFVIHAYRPGIKKKHVDVKVYFHWINNHGVARVKWHDTHNQRRLSSVTRRHIRNRR